MSSPVLSFNDVSLTYRTGPVWSRRTVHAVDQVTLAIASGEILGLVGESGSGKTTMGRLALGLLSPSAGTVRFDGGSLPRRREMRGRLAVVLQQPEWALNPRLRVGTSVAEPLAIRGAERDEIDDRVRRGLEQVGLDPAMVRRFPHELSGGQRQRAAIARALITEPRFVVFDEAVSALDVSVQMQVLNLIRELQTERAFSTLFISHDLAATRYVADRIAVMRLGRLVEVAEATRFYGEPEHEYSRELWRTARHAQ